MSMFEWKPEYNVGHPGIDTQHKKLFQYADDLAAAMSAGKGKDVMARTLASLVDYTKQHFASEEVLMKTHNYPEYPQHKAMHDGLTAQVVKFQKDFAEGKTVVTVDLLMFLKNWLAHHIGETDRKIATFLKTKAA